MDNSARLHSQVAQMAGVSHDVALTACYLLTLSRAGKTIVQACELSRMDRADVRDVARDWGIRFPDYAPADKPLLLVWSKIGRGRWELRRGSELLASIATDSKGKYWASWTNGGPSEDGSTPLVAARRLSKYIDHRALELLGVDDIAINFRNPDGSVERLAPIAAEDPRKLQLALHS